MLKNSIYTVKFTVAEKSSLILYKALLRKRFLINCKISVIVNENNSSKLSMRRIFSLIWTLF